MIKVLSRAAVVVMVVLLAGISSMGVQSELYPVDESKLIEVCADGVVFVPPGTKFVRCNGKVMKVDRIEEGVVRESINCRCPRCCDGLCYIIVACNPVPQEQLDRITRDCATGILYVENPQDLGGLCTMYLSC
jgi:hypothetical protein